MMFPEDIDAGGEHGVGTYVSGLCCSDAPTPPVYVRIRCS